MSLLTKILNGNQRTDPNALLLEELQTQNAKLNSKLMGLSAQLAQQRLETDRLRRSVRRQKPSYSWIAERAALDAKGLFLMQMEGIQPSRKNARDTLAMSTRRWQWARALAMLAGVHDGELFSETTDARLLVQRLSEHTSYAAEKPDLWRQFRAK